MKEKIKLLKFTAKIKAYSREDIISELKWFIEQIEEEADGGGTDDDNMRSSWEIIE